MAVVAARDYYDMGHDAGELAVRVMRGEKPAAIPLKQATTSRLLLESRRSTVICGVKFPDDVLEAGGAEGDRRRVVDEFTSFNEIMDIKVEQHESLTELLVRRSSGQHLEPDHPRSGDRRNVLLAGRIACCSI